MLGKAAAIEAAARKGVLSMLRILVAIAATALSVNASSACALCGGHDPIVAQQRARCQSIIAPKNLTGAVHKSEWKKCMNAPDSYK